MTNSLQEQRARVGEFLSAQQTRLEQAELFVEQEIQRLEEELQKQQEETGHLRLARDALMTRLTQTELRLSESRSMATRLTQQIRKQSGLNWETEKQRLIAALEADFDENDAAQQGERLQIKDVMRTTEEIIAAKDREIQELKQPQKEQVHDSTAKAPDMIAMDQIHNADAIVQEERERLKRLQEEWREKLRHAEVEIALERANLARQRAELEEHLRTAKEAALKSPQTDTAKDQADSSPQGRWLARLGLTPADREPSRQS